ncbi:universal stress protein [Candidatus Nitrosotalea bavarica]|uniref:universal stress protein n=1 Tax=Candidatus Nitrosotalea bavarica TaxID=1903277 RepID=UPI0010558EF3|nr:universal stress protein [Candidatus Nitrosotalea bavarica]
MIKRALKKILVPMDGSKSSFSALDEAIYMASQFDAQITVLYVLHVAYDNPDLVNTPETRKLLKKVTKFLEKAEKQVMKNKISFKKETLFGQESKKIVDYSQKEKFDLIVMGSRGLSSIKRMILGSVASSVVTKSKIPVLVVK